MSIILTQSAIEASLKNDVGLKALFNNNVRLYAEPIKYGAMPYLVWRKWEAKPVSADFEGSNEYTVTLEVVCEQTGQELAKKIIDAVKKWAVSTKPSNASVNIPLIIAGYADVYQSRDKREFYGIIKLKIISEIIN